MDDILKGLAGGEQGQQSAGQSGGGIGDLLGGLLSGGGLGSVLGPGAGGGSAPGGGLGSMLPGGLAALLPALLPALLGMLGGKSGNQSGAHQLVDAMNAKGMGDVAGSWVGTGANQPMTAAQVEELLTPEQLAQLGAESGLPADQVKQGVAAILPDVVNSLTPHGTLPDQSQVQATTDQLQSALAGLSARQP